jgi:hypothetical protein
MRVNRVVFAGSVAPKDYDWQTRLSAHQVERVRNYVGTVDWVVALFPRLFELRPVRSLHNQLGSAGFNGFDAGGDCGQSVAQQSKDVTNVCYVKGEHSAFEGRVTEIVQFLLLENPSDAVREDRPAVGLLLGLRGTVWLTWFAIVAVILYVGVRVVSAAPSPMWVVLVLFVLLVIRTLQVV